MCTTHFPPFFSLYRPREERGGLLIKGTFKMKKTLAALAVLGAFAGTAAAADVTLYGVVDYGFNYQHVDGDAKDVDANDTFKMMSGQNSGSRFGLKGTEDLGNGLKLGFVLENGFNADDGSLGNGGRLFGRESQVNLQGAFGTVSFGRVGELVSANGSYCLMGKASPFSGGWQDSVGQKFVYANGFDRYDNMITYVTPSFNGFKVHAQYSFKNDGKDGHGVEGKASADRYYAIGATFETQNLYLVGVVDSKNWGSVDTDVIDSGNHKIDDQLSVTLGGAYDFGFMKLYASGQYFDNAKSVGTKAAGADGSIVTGYKFFSAYVADDKTTTNKDEEKAASGEGAEGYGINIGVGVPAFGGTAKAQIAYMDAEAVADSKLTVERWSIAVGYDYNLTKRTSVYTAAAYTRDKLSKEYRQSSFGEGYGENPSTVEVMAGLIHKF